MLAINYISGTTGAPKGVMYHHRGAYLQALATALHNGLGPTSRYLWTLPMFHCHGWCFPWEVTAAGGTHVCLRAVDADTIWQLLRKYAITHFSAAPTLGEVAVRGNDVMLGYYRDEAATRAATVDGWLRTGDLAVMHPDGYVEIRDRRKDVIISGGENISSVEVERVLDSHPAVLESAVVGPAHDTWGEVPVAFVSLRSGHTARDQDLVSHVRSRIAPFKAPKRIVFGSLPKTSTGKIRKKRAAPATGLGHAHLAGSRCRMRTRCRGRYRGCGPCRRDSDVRLWGLCSA